MAALIAMLSSTLPAVADGNKVSAPYDWVIEMETKPLSRQFEYTDSALKKIEKVQVAYYPPGGDDNKTAYEYLWFNSGKACGMEKQRKFDLPQGEGVCLKVVHKNGNSTEEEKRASAGAILRLAIDTYLNKNPIVQVRLPADSYNDIVNELTNHGLEVAPEGNEWESSFTSSLTLNIYSEPDGMKTVLYKP